MVDILNRDTEEDQRIKGTVFANTKTKREAERERMKAREELMRITSAKPKKKRSERIFEELARRAETRKKVEQRLLKGYLSTKKVREIRKKALIKRAKGEAGLFFKTVTGTLGVSKGRKTRLQDQIRVLRFRNRLERQRLLNQVQRMRLLARVERLRKKGVLPALPIRIPIEKPAVFYPSFSTQMERDEIDSAFKADIGFGDDLWGKENFFGGESYYNEDFYGTEFDSDPFYHLQIRPQRGVHPFFW